MIVQSDPVSLVVGESPMRVVVTRPRDGGRFPGILLYSDIFQLTPTMLRACTRLAGYGFVVAAPEVYHRVEAPGWAPPFDDEGRTRGMEDASKTAVAEFDADARAVLDFLASHPSVAPGQLGAGGFCIGGHLALRAALQPDVGATACFYPTGVHDGRLGRDPDAGTLARLAEIRGELLIVFGTLDPHVPAEGRVKIEDALRDAGVEYTALHLPAEHAFMRDEGPRHDPEATDQAWAAMLALFRRIFSIEA